MLPQHLFSFKCITSHVGTCLQRTAHLGTASHLPPQRSMLQGWVSESPSSLHIKYHLTNGYTKFRASRANTLARHGKKQSHVNPVREPALTWHP